MSRSKTDITPANISRRCRAWIAALRGSRGRVLLPPLDRAALVVLDAQRIFCDPASPAYLPAWEACAPRTWALADHFIRTKRPVIFTRHFHPTRDPENPINHFFTRLLTANDPLSELMPEANERIPPAILHVKHRHAAFSEYLHGSLDSVRYLVLAGVQTHLCVLATAIDLARRGRIPIVVADGCAARDEMSHLAALRVLTAGHAHVVTASELSAALERKDKG